MTDDEELDFSSYLVDLDDEEQDIDKYIGPSSFNTAPSSTLTTPNSLIGGSFAASTSYPSSFAAAGSGAGSGGTGGVGAAFQPANTHTSSGGASTVKKGELNSNKAWSGALLSQRGFPSVSPSPPESASDSSYKTNSGSISGSGSAPASAAGTGTAPSSIASSSYPSDGGASSWGTQKTLNPQHSLLSTTAASGASTSTSNLEGAGAGAVGHSDIGSNLSTPTAEFIPPSSSSTSSSALSASRHHYSSSQSAATSGSLQQLSGKPSTTTHSAKSHNGKGKATSLNSSSSSSNHNHTSSQHPPLDLSFSYDFAHDPSLNTAFSAAQAAHAHGQGALSGTHSAAAAAGPSHTSSTSSASTTTSHHAPPAAAPLSLSEPFNDKSQYSTSLPSSSINGFASRASRGSADRSALANSSSSSSSNNNNNNNTISSIPIPSTSANSSLDLGKPISPSSGPQHVSRGHRSRQASASSGALSSSYSGPSGISAFASGGGSAAGYASSPHWLSMTPTSPSGLPASTGGGGSSGSSGGGGGSATGTSHTSNISGQPHVQFASKPYSRPIAPAPDASGSSGAGHHHHQHQHGGSLPSSSMTGGGAGGSGAGGSSKSGSGGSLSKRPSKRKTISNASSNASASASMHQLQTAGIASLAPLQPQTQGSSSASGSAPSASSSARGGSGQLQQYQLPPNATLLPQASAAATAGVQAQTLAQAQAQAQPLGVSQFGYPVAGSHYRDPMSAVASPISPSLDSFSAFSPNYNLAATPITAASSAATSPSAANSQQYSQYQHAAVISPYIQQQHFQYQQQQQQQQQQQYSQGQASTSASASSKPNSTASTPNDAILSAVTAPSPFDPRNFGSLSFDPLSATDDFAAQQWYGQSAGTPAPSSQAAMEVNRAAALAGIGGKWINWTNSQVEGQDQDANLISTVLHDSPEVANAPTPSAPHASGSGAGPHASGPSKAASPAAMFDPFPHRESSVVTSPSGDIEGLSPEDLAARDPLATHLWRLYAKAKAGLPNGARMENITWRMMSLKLNKQKASAGAGGVGSPPAATQGAQQTSFQPPNTAEVAATSNAVLQEAEEAGRGRRGRSSGPNSASPAADAAEFEEMDWRKHSRSRSRVPQAIAGGMDWRGNSRSRSRAPNMRISMPSGPSGFHLPTYADIVETMASVSRAPQDVATGTSSANATVQPNNLDPQHTFAAPVTLSHISQPGMLSFEQSLKQLVQDRDAQPGDMPAPTGGQASSGGNGPSTAAPYSYVPPAPLPLSPSHWINSPQSVQDGATPAVSAGEVPESSNINIVPGQQTQQSQYEQAVSASSQPQSMPRSGGASIGSDATVDSQKSISASVEAYLSSLEHATSVIDLPPHRHVGSIPGLFNEQELKANQHADYGFIPKLVRKTSFDASYPAQLAHEQQKSKSHKRRQPAQQQEHSGIASPAPQSATPHFSQLGNVQNWSDPNNLFLMDNINSYLQGPAQSVPSTPSALSASFTFNFLNQAQPGYSAPFSPYGGDPADLNAQASAQAQVHAQTAAVEAFRRLQNAQALQAANAAAHQQMQHQAQGQTPVYNTPYLDPNYAGSPGTVPPEVFAAAMSAMQYQPAGMHVNPSQVSGLSYSPNAYPGYTDPGTASWPASPQANHPSPVSHYPSPEETAAVAEEGRLQSALSSRASSMSNIPSLLSQSFTADQTPDSPEKSVTKKAHSRHLSAVSTALPESNAEGSGKETVCVNCKTTNTPLWRRDEHGQPLCNACQLFRKLHGSDRPVSLHNSVVKKRNRTRTNKEAPKKSTSRSQRTVASPKPSDEGTAIEAQ